MLFTEGALNLDQILTVVYKTAWPPRRLCYRPAVFNRYLLIMRFHSRKKIDAYFKRLFQFLNLFITVLTLKFLKFKFCNSGSVSTATNFDFLSSYDILKVSSTQSSYLIGVNEVTMICFKELLLREKIEKCHKMLHIIRSARGRHSTVLPT
jgi:hypothetical protein